jgi:saccharopine dehydrogenase-like NADP-dependent oxidoreductase
MAKREMKVIAVGGCGGMGQFAVRTALTFDFVREIVVADRDGARARAFAERCGPKAAPMELDVLDEKALSSALRGKDVVLATVGPYYRFGLPVLRAAIAAGCDYVDINDDWEPTLEMLDLDAEARNAGVTAIIGMGASPGVSNLLAVEALSVLDEVGAVITGWGAPGDGEGGGMPGPGEGGTYGAATDHWLHQLTGTIRLWRGGKLTDVRPLEEIEVRYPGIGARTAHTVGHPEPVTLPRYFPQLRESCNVMSFARSLMAALKWLAGKVDGGEMSFGDAADWLTRLEQGEGQAQMLSALPPEILAQLSGVESEDSPALPSLFAVAYGARNGRTASVAATLSSAPPGSMGAITGIPMAIGLRMIAEGKIRQRGVFAPEAIVDPDAFFDALAPFCEPKRTSHEDLLVITTSP